MSPVSRIVEISGLKGLLALDDPVLDQIRKLQLEISNRRRVGATVLEYRQILNERAQQLGAYQTLVADPLLTITKQWQTDGSPQRSPIIIGMASLIIKMGQAYTEADVFDLIVREDYRNRNFSLELLDRASFICQKTGVTRAIAHFPMKHAAIYRAYYEREGYVGRGSEILELRFREEG